jgi:hypothetical protein
LKAGPNQMETLRRLRTAAEAIDKDVTVRSERIRQPARVPTCPSVNETCR